MPDELPLYQTFFDRSEGKYSKKYVRGERLYPYLTGIGLDPQTLTAAWDASRAQTTWNDGRDTRDLNQAYLINCLTIQRLEKLRPGSARILFDEFNINCFGRYPMRTLIDQYDNRNDTSSRYGIALFPRIDNGATYYEGEVLKELHTKLKTRGWHLRISEVHKDSDILAPLDALSAKYNASNMTENASPSEPSYTCLHCAHSPGIGVAISKVPMPT